MPQVSICIPTYNSAHFLAQTIESVRTQDYRDYELVICDNASTDATPELCRKYTDSRVRYLRSEDQTNQAGNFNRCLDAARGEYLTLLHADDYFLPGFLRDRVERLNRRPEVAFICGAVQLIDKDGSPLSIQARWEQDQLLSSRQFQEVLLHGCVVSPPSLMARRSCVDKAGRFYENWTWGHDWEWSFRLAGQGQVAYAATPRAAYRVHDGSGTAEVLNAARNGRQERLILREMLGALASTGEESKELRRSAFHALCLRHMYFAERALLNKRKKAAFHNLQFALLSDPRMILKPTWWALACGCLGPVAWYDKYRDFRSQVTAEKSAV